MITEGSATNQQGNAQQDELANFSLCDISSIVKEVLYVIRCCI